MARKKLYESIQVMERKIEAQNKYISELLSSSVSSKNSINPFVVNSCAYNIVLSVADKIQCVSRYDFDIPELGLPSNKLECLFYDYGALAFSRYKGKPMVTSFAKTGDLNGIGDLKEIIPIDFAGKSYDVHCNVVYNKDVITNPCVIIQDYTGSYREDGIYPRSAVNAVSINDQSEIYRQLKNSVKLTAKKAVALIESEGARAAAERNLSNLIDNDSPIISIIGDGVYEQMKLHNLDTRLDLEGYIRAIEAYERMRSNFNGILTRTPFDKKERQITSEVTNDNILTDIYIYDGLINRQIGLELMKSHRIVSDGSVKINDILDRKKRQQEMLSQLKGSNKLDEDKNDGK